MTGNAYRATQIAILRAQSRVSRAQSEMALAQAELAQALDEWDRSPVSLHILVAGKEPQGMPTPVNDVQFFVNVVAHDQAGRTVPDPDALTYTVADVASDLTTQNPSTAASLAEDPNFPGDNSHQEVNVTPADAAGNQSNFKVFVTDGTRSAITDELVPTAGGPTRLEIGVREQ